jgi:tetratricopeptide (TPR) repeat protein
LSRAGQVQVVAWLGACLAEALKYAHERGLVHLDVKPSNILVTADRQPMLLDFHLAREPLAPGEPGARFGGTPAYMSPEQRRALAELRTGGRVAEVVDGRSDVYSLGLVMVEALGGSLPPEGPEPRPLIRCNRAVSLGLSDILTKCLATRPCDRYQDAGALAADLWCELNHQPLRGVANRSVVERWRKWRRRKPHMLSVLGLLAAVLVVAGAALTFAFLHAGHRVDEAQRALSEGQKQIRSGRYKEAAATLERGLAQLARLPFHADLRASLGQRLRMAARSGAAEELHQIADRIRMAYGAEGASASKLRTIEHHCRALWDKRALILDRLGQELEPYVEDRIQTDLLDLAVLGGSLRVRLAEASEGVRARQEALEMLSQAEAFWRPSAVLFHERGLHAGALGLDDVVRAARRGEAEHPPRSTWEHYALGRSLLQGGDPGAAADAFDQALAREPHGLWPNFYRGVASYQLGRFDDAALAFTVSTTLAPGNAGCFYNRALALVGLARPDRALADFNRALELDPVFAEAALDRGRLHFHAGRLREAEADFNLALCEGSIPAQVHFHLALVWLERKDLARAVHHLEACRTVDPTHAHAAQLLEELRRPRS